MATLREIMGGANRQVMMDLGVQQPLDNSPLLATGAIVTDAAISAQVRAGIRKIDAYYVSNIDTSLESNYGNTVYTDIAQPRGISGGTTQARVSFQNEAFLESSLERMLIGQSPLTLMKTMIDNYWTKQFEHRAVATMFGIRNFVMNSAAGIKDQFVVNNSKTTGADAASGFSIDQFIDVEATLDPSMRGAGAIVVHPKIAAKMRKQTILEKLVTSDNAPAVEVYNGRTVIEVNSPMTVIGTGANAQYISYLVGAGAFVGDSVVGNDDLEVDRTAATGNGAGHTALWTRRNILIHPQGFNFIATDEQLTGGTKNEALSASWTDLTNKDYWTLGTDAARTSIRFLVTNL